MSIVWQCEDKVKYTTSDAWGCKLVQGLGRTGIMYQKP